MRNLFIPFALLCFCTASPAQTTKQEVLSKIEYAGSNYFSYPGGHRITPAPKGYVPFYISHYGRHGSRYMVSNRAYHNMLPLFEKAEKEGKLTKLGQQVYVKLKKAYANAHLHGGELTALGGRQHEGIAERMYKNYPEVFVHDSRVEASSTMVHRCQESMQFFCGKLKHLNHDVNIQQRTTNDDRYFMRIDDVEVPEGALQKDIDKRMSEINDSLRRTVKLAPRLFTDPRFVEENLKDPLQLVKDFYDISQDMQCLPELKINFKGIFTKDELFDLWRVANNGWVRGQGFIQGATPNYRKHYNLLHNFLDRADEAISKNQKGAALRFGHDSYIVPLAFIMQFDGSRDFPTVNHMEDLYKYYASFKITPMAANIQFIFYRNPGSDDILVKFLLNEVEQHIPLKTDMWPYYHWTDVKRYYEQRMASF